MVFKFRYYPCLLLFIIQTLNIACFDGRGAFNLGGGGIHGICSISQVAQW